MLSQLILAAAGVGGTLAIHFGALSWLLRREVLAVRLRSATVLAFVLLFAHLLEIGIYAALYRAGVGWGLGEFRGAFAATASDYFYYSAVTYTTVGFGDITPPPELRIVTAIEAINGIVMVGLTTSAMLVVLSRAVRERSEA
jgi:hypothetical protein